MAWNEPDKDKTPWGNENRAPELDEIVRNLNRRFGSLFGGGRGGGNGGVSAGLIIAIALMIGAVYVLAGLYTVDAGSRGVVQRFGKFHGISDPGLRWRPPVVDKVTIVNTDKVQEFNHSSAMLTGDANIIEIDLNVQYRHVDPTKYVFNVKDPDESLREVTEAAIRGVAGKYDMETIQTTRRNDVATQTRENIQLILDRYDAGIEVTKVNLNETEFPSQVQDAVQDVIKASRDQERYILEAEAYSNDILPKAGGTAQRILQDSEAYRDRIIADAIGEADRFKALLTEYSAAPQVTRKRLYLETMEQVYGDTAKVLMDTEGSGNLVYLPVDKLMDQTRRTSRSDMQSDNIGGAESAVEARPSTRSNDETSRRRSRDR